MENHNNKNKNPFNPSLQEFLQIDYARALELLKMLQQHKLNYQRFFISLVAIISTISIGLINFAASDNFIQYTLLNMKLSITELVGMLLLISFLVGYLILRNLASIRKSEVFFNNSIILLRKRFIDEFKLGESYPNLNPVKALRRNSADYFSIVICAIINLLLLVAGFALLFKNLHGLIPIFMTAIGSVLYVIIYYITIENYLADLSETH